MASTSIKLAGGLSAKDAAAFSKEMHCEPEFLQGMRKHRDYTEFACFVRNVTPAPIRLTVPFGEMERRPKVSAPDYAALLADNRRRYAGGSVETPPPDEPAAQEVPASRSDFGLSTPGEL